jgi:hypothetical protein
LKQGEALLLLPEFVFPLQNTVTKLVVKELALFPSFKKERSFCVSRVWLVAKTG